ncbi:energy-coupling factor transporter transmembrane protein EcfT [Glaciibacter flavus]|uniref:Energy-coupling factor transporter transmembrane protein EcfT n=1 Tax=Orlajensenia flava TaxID=2565934 RepID=A0A4S4FVS7_9MICO|nr:energy-coupling factor transporter transmembrane component T [Glaciibacter flavus]THG35020.1 energy-coupling factor transporter transmembrane protein EcfT [Glaciibacter flavus]
MSAVVAERRDLDAESPRAWLDGVNPVTRLLAAVVLSVPLFASIDAVSASVAVLLELALLPFTGVALAVLARRALPLVAFAPIAGLSMLLYAEPGGTVHARFWLATISDESIRLAVAVALRVIALGIPTILLFSRVDPTRLADALAQVAHLPSRFVLGVLAGTRLLGLFIDDWRSLSMARRARGVADTGAIRRFASMAFVLLVFAVRRGSKLAVAMEARAFGSGLPRTWARPSTLSWRDGVLVVVAVAIMAAAIGAAVATGAFRFVGS